MADMDVKPWKCKTCGATLGMVERNGSGIRHLLLYRHPVVENEAMEEVDVITVIEGCETSPVKCTCGAVRIWVPGQEALDHLVERVLSMRGA